ncbi:hypothetical protein [Caballeronia sp. GAWG2-1]|uniref:hypothetical protein n=1 Tax=Caballeronia sp. GAWG2-1 TaxID=2921744 RepID=UPI0020278948|nr:hypothetical protein [Caballeronia sp. GAWG2-1]
MNAEAGSAKVRDERVYLDTDAEELSVTTIVHPYLLREQVADRRQYRRFRHYTFIGMAGLIAVLLVMLAAWIITFGWRIFGSSARNYSSHVELLLAPLVVLASLVAVSMLPIVRLVFRQLGDKDDNKNSVTIWQTVISEIGDALKEYLGRSPKSPA